jgi:hypothetical protein
MDRFFRPYEIRPGGPIRVVIESKDGARVEVVGKVERVPLVAEPSR